MNYLYAAPFQGEFDWEFMTYAPHLRYLADSYDWVEVCCAREHEFFYRDFADITALKQEVDTLLSAAIKVPQPTSQLPLIPVEQPTGLAKSHRRQRK